MDRRQLLFIFAALVIGGGLYLVLSLDPVWWLAWILPGLLFAVALHTDGWMSRGLVTFAALIGASSNLVYLLKVMPLAPTMIILLLMTLMWVFIIGAARRIVKTWEAPWTVLALPVVAVAVDTLLARFAPDGNFGSLAYTQAEVLPVAQFASLFGLGGILFVLMLVNSALALLLTYRLRWPRARVMYGAVLFSVALLVAFGAWRLQTERPGTAISFGIAVVDDYIEATRSAQARDIWTQYQAQVQELAGSGARVVLLPEKIDVLIPQDADARKSWLARVARENHVWLVAGLGVDDGTQRRNEAWWFSPDGRLVTNYLKHFMAPPEREFVVGNEFPVNDIGGVRYGVAICKDMHFASLGRAFGERRARVMLVPAWDFDLDAWMTANMTKMRGIESGYVIVRASRNGLLTVSDAFGRMLAVERSARLPGSTLFATVEVSDRIDTLYTRIGDMLGWICVAAAALLLGLAYARQRRARLLASLNE